MLIPPPPQDQPTEISDEITDFLSILEPPVTDGLDFLDSIDQSVQKPSDHFPAKLSGDDDKEEDDDDDTLEPPLPAEMLRDLDEYMNGAPKDEEVVEKKITHWTYEEHKLFLSGLKKYGHSWIKISNEFVKTKSPSQITSHAQKYFLHQKKVKSRIETAAAAVATRKKRKSIHDITLDNPDLP